MGKKGNDQQSVGMQSALKGVMIWFCSNLFTDKSCKRKSLPRAQATLWDYCNMCAAFRLAILWASFERAASHGLAASCGNCGLAVSWGHYALGASYKSAASWDYCERDAPFKLAGLRDNNRLAAS
eukprot:1157773-Pelagomonas_calceolata.AAC.4